jgi:cytochrome P450
MNSLTSLLTIKSESES